MFFNGLLAAVTVLIFFFASHAQATTYYVDEGSGNNSYNGFSDVVTNGNGPKLNVSAAISVASNGSVIVVDTGYYGESTWNLGTNSLTLDPQGTVNICGPDLCGADTVGDGIPDWWRLEYFGTPTTTNGSSCASCTSTNPWAHGLTNLQVYQNPTILIADNYSTVGDGVPDWWKVKYGFVLNDLAVAYNDADSDGYMNLQEYLYETDPLDPTSHPDYLPPDFAGWWKFDEGTGTITMSAVGTNLTGILTGATHYPYGAPE
jgi:hypothetical protein